MTLYKPTREEALRLLLERLPCPLPCEEVPVADAARRVSAEAVIAPSPFPRVDLSMRDGVALDQLAEPTQRLEIRTGEQVPGWAVAVVPSEDYDPAGPFDVFAEGQEGRRPSIVRAGSEYAAGDTVVEDHVVLDHRHLAQLSWFGVERLKVLRRPRIRLAVFDTAPASSAATAFLRGFLATFCDVEGSLGSLSSVAELRALPVSDDLILVVSDGAPGRYAQLRALFEAPWAGFEPLAWKLGLFPCKHLGLGLLHGVPTLVLPDVFFKTALSAYAFLPDILAAMTGMQTHKRLASFVELPSIAYPYPCLVPLRIEEERLDLRVRGTKLRSSFSGRHVSAAEAYVILDRAPQPEGLCEAVLLDKLVRGDVPSKQ